ncbi:hypothetical protein [Sporosarcina sp. OR05]|uniref:hypothetical protein n=1 Tax=Sporosarcina sp. OR05 TaxID=2969819 RepID=UPI00352BB7AE
MNIEIGVIGALFGFLISYFSFLRSRDKDVKKEATEKVVTNTKLDHIGAGVNSIQVKMEVKDERMTALTEKVIRIDESAKSAHKRIDKIERDDEK